MPPGPPLFVTRPDLPALDALRPALEQIWASRQLTNNGPFVKQLEAALCGFLDVPAVSLFCNGTLALLAAIRALDLQGEVITTPFSFVATTHALRWAGLEPVFVDIEPETFTLDAARLAAALTPRTCAVLPVHVYGHPCDTEALAAFAQRHGLKLLYDAAHAFGVRTPGANLLRAGDLSMLSFHATKVFHTLEGGAVVSPDAATKRRIDQLRNFGFTSEVSVESLGINGKMNELQAAIGTLLLPDFETHNRRRAAIDAAYRSGLAGVPGLALPPVLPASRVAAHNHSYFPLRVLPGFGCSRDALYQHLRDAGVVARRYFHPLISEFPMYTGARGADPANLPVATRVAREVLCLPLYAGLADDEVARVIAAVRAAA